MDQTLRFLPDHPHRQGKKVALQTEQAAAQAGLLGREPDLCAVLLLKIPVAGTVVDMGVGAQDGRGRQALLQQRVLQILPFLQQAGIKQNTFSAAQQIQGDQLLPLKHIGIALYLSQLHGCSPPYFSVPRRDWAVFK